MSAMISGRMLISNAADLVFLTIVVMKIMMKVAARNALVARFVFDYPSFVVVIFVFIAESAVVSRLWSKDCSEKATNVVVAAADGMIAIEGTLSVEIANGDGRYVEEAHASSESTHL